MIHLRDYQKRSIEELRVALAAGQKPVLSSPTGSGKTVICAEIFSMARQRGKRVAFCVPMIGLIQQTWDAFSRAGLPMDDMSIIQASHHLYRPWNPIQICSVDTLVRRQLPEADLIVFDEVHRQSKLYKRWMEEAPDARFFGVSATPWARGMGEIWDRMIVVATTRQLIDEGHLAPFRYFAPASPDLTGVQTTAGDFQQDQLSQAMNQPKLVADVVKTWMERGGNRPTLVFAVDCAHARSLAEQFNAAGVPCGYVDAFTEIPDRLKLIEQLKKGELKVISSVGTMTTGVDAPFVSCLIMARPTRSKMLYVQMVGRGLRTDPGKRDCVILDHADNATRLGLPDEIHYDDFIKARALEREERGPAMPKKCPQCTYLKPAGHTGACPYCGFESAPPRSQIVCEDGQLVEMGAGRKKAKAAPIDDKQRWYSSLLWIAEEKGYKNGWVAHKYKEKFGVWPKGLLDSPAYPTHEVRGWLKSQQIAWAKARGGQNRAFTMG